ncbi:hypothetical protein [Haloarchaeobius sp. HRN-SO-5]|uniref:hypothetical protein n=1 Tax=Haloarchaeobius sp. HRN-SO-5 TaxID=3446118 RepID=UPI003EBFDA29
MERRDLLRRTGAVLATGAVAGCLTDDADAGSGGDPDGTGPELVSRSVETVETGCGTENAATVAFDDGNGTVTLQGSISASTPCHVAAIERADFDAESRTLVVVVTAEDDGSDGCVQCLGQVDYTASFEFAGGLPDSVEVRHASMGETTTVATGSR